MSLLSHRLNGWLWSPSFPGRLQLHACCRHTHSWSSRQPPIMPTMSRLPDCWKTVKSSCRSYCVSWSLTTCPIQSLISRRSFMMCCCQSCTTGSLLQHHLLCQISWHWLCSKGQPRTRLCWFAMMVYLSRFSCTTWMSCGICLVSAA